MAYIPPNPNGSATSANSAPVVIASDQATIPVSSASLPLPTGASTSAKQDTGNTSVASIDTKTPALGQALAAASVPVILPSATITTLTPPAAITGFATSAKQDTGNTSLSSLDGKITAVNTGAVVVSSSVLPSGAATSAKQPALGTATTANSTPVNIASDQTVPVSLTSVPSHAVTNAGTFATQATLAAETTKVIGTVNQGTSPWTINTGSATGSAMPTNAFAIGGQDGNNNLTMAVMSNKFSDGYGGGQVLTTSQYVYNGSTYDRQRGDSTNGAYVNVKTSVLPTGAALDATLTGGTQQTKITDGTNIGNVVAGDSGFNGQAVASATKTISFTTSSSGVQTLLANTDVRGYSWIEIVYTSVGVGLALAPQFSTVSGGTYVSLTASSFINSSSSTPTVLGTTVNTIYSSATKGNYFQLAVSALTSGTFAGTITLRAAAPPYASLQAVQNGTWTVGSNSATGSAVPANAFYMGVSGTSGLTGIVGVGNITDGTAGNNAVSTGGMIYNGTNWDRQRNNESVTLLASAARTTTQTSADLINYNGATYVDVILDMTVVGTGSVTITINGKDPASGKYYLLLAGAAVTSNSTNVYTLNPHLTTPVTNVSAQKTLPRTFQVVVTANNANSATYSVGYNLSRG